MIVKQPLKFFIKYAQLLKNVQAESENCEENCDPLCCLSKDGVKGLCLVLGEEGFACATDGTGQASLLTGLEQNNSD